MNTDSPLTQLSAHLDADMIAVNAQIMRQMQSDVPMIPKLASYLIAAGGKRVRPLLTLASATMFGGDMTRAHGLAAAVEFIHTATLLHDDVVDESDQRRGQESANLVFGNQATVLVGDFLFSRAFQLMVADGNLQILKILSDASAVIAEGEVLQLSVAGQVDTPMETYLKVIEAKTAALFKAACEVGPVIAGADDRAVRAMAEYGHNMGIAFQITDDALDYDADQIALGKTIGDDFREKKMTAPVLLAYAQGDTDERAFWTRVMDGDAVQGDGDLARAQDILTVHNAVGQALDMARDYGARAISALDGLPSHAVRDMLIGIVKYTIDRKT